MTTESTRHTSSGMHTRLVNTAADVISRAMQQGRTLPAALAVALDSAQLLQSPDTAAEFEKLLRWHDEDGKAIDAATRLRDELRSRIAELEADREANDREYEAATARIAELESERHTTNEALSDAAEQLRRDRDRVAELEKLVEQATEFRIWEPGYGLYVRRAPGTTGFAVMEARRTDKGRRVWTTAGWQYSALLSDIELFCWPDAQTAVAEARRIMPGGAK